MVATSAGIFAKLWNLLSSPIGYVTANMFEAGGKKVGEKITEKVEKMFEIGEKTLDDEVIFNNVIAEMDDSVRKPCEEFMRWLKEQQPDGKKRAEKVREFAIRKISWKEIQTGGGKKGGKTSEKEKKPDYIIARLFVTQMMANGDNDSIIQWLDGIEVFSTIGIDKKSKAGIAAKKVGNVLKTEAREGSIAAKSVLDDLADWLDSK